MKPLENLFYEEQTEINELTVKLVENTRLLVDYIDDPDTVIDKILSKLSTDDKEYDVFYDISKGLNGAYTRDRAIVLGKNNVIYYITTITNTIRKELTELVDAGKQNLDILKVNLDSILSTNDSDKVATAAMKAISTPVDKEYLAIKLTRILEPKIAGDVVMQKELSSFISNWLLLVQDSLVDPRLKDDLNNAIDKLKHIKIDNDTSNQIISHIINEGVLNDEIEEHIISDKVVEPTMMVTEEPYLVPRVNSMDNDTPIDATVGIVEVAKEVKSKLDGVQADYDELVKSTNSITSTTSIEYALEDIVNVIKVYEKDEIVLSELDARLKAFNIVYANHKNIMNEAYNVLGVNMVKLNSGLNILDESSSVIKEVLYTNN